MQRDQLFAAVYEALDFQHCAVCSLSLKGVQRFIDGFLYERVNDPWVRNTLIESRGFCPAHSWQLSGGFDSATGIAIVYRHLLEEFSHAFADRTERQAVGADGSRWFPWSDPANHTAAREIRTWLVPRTPCPACTDQWDAEDRYVWTTAEYLFDQDFRARYGTSLGLCVRHLTAVIDTMPQSADLAWLITTERRLMEALMQDLSEFWRKHDYRFHEEPMSEGERTCARRVLHKLVGGPGMVWRR